MNLITGIVPLASSDSRSGQWWTSVVTSLMSRFAFRRTTILRVSDRWLQEHEAAAGKGQRDSG